MEPRDDPSCQSCRFWQSDAGEMGDCRRHAPRPALEKSLPALPPEVEAEEEFSQEAVWPVTFASDWCGEFRERPAIFRPSWGAA